MPSPQNRIQLRIAQGDEDHVVCIVRLQRGCHRDTDDRYAGREQILDPQTVGLNLIRPVAPGQQRDVLPGSERISCKIIAQYARAEY